MGVPVPDLRKPPIRLWKYRTWDEKGHTRALIVNGEVYFAPKSQLNDPFEFRWREKLPTAPTAKDRFIRELCAHEGPNDTPKMRRIRYARLMASMDLILSQRKGGIGPTLAKINLGVFCASEVNDNILMWSYYAGNHSGVCIGVRTDLLEPKRMVLVTYREKVPLMDGWAYPTHNRAAFVAASLVKSAAWKHEQEWRTIDDAGVRKFPDCVDRVIVGALASRETRTAVHEAVAAAPHKVEIFEAKLSDTHFSIDILPGAPGRSPNQRKKRKKHGASMQ